MSPAKIILNWKLLDRRIHFYHDYESLLWFKLTVNCFFACKWKAKQYTFSFISFDYLLPFFKQLHDFEVKKVLIFFDKKQLQEDFFAISDNFSWVSPAFFFFFLANTCNKIRRKRSFFIFHIEIVARQTIVELVSKTSSNNQFDRVCDLK